VKTPAGLGRFPYIWRCCRRPTPPTLRPPPNVAHRFFGPNLVAHFLKRPTRPTAHPIQAGWVIRGRRRNSYLTDQVEAGCAAGQYTRLLLRMRREVIKGGALAGGRAAFSWRATLECHRRRGFFAWLGPGRLRFGGRAATGPPSRTPARLAAARRIWLRPPRGPVDGTDLVAEDFGAGGEEGALSPTSEGWSGAGSLSPPPPPARENLWTCTREPGGTWHREQRWFRHCCGNPGDGRVKVRWDRHRVHFVTERPRGDRAAPAPDRLRLRPALFGRGARAGGGRVGRGG